MYCDLSRMTNWPDPFSNHSNFDYFDRVESAPTTSNSDMTFALGPETIMSEMKNLKVRFGQ